MITFSLIIPVYNVQLYLRECLTSVLKQTYNDFEAIVIDDGSSDGSELICDEFGCQDKRIRVFHQKNSGVFAARNLGLEYAQGEYVIFIDSDDYVVPHFLETISKKMSDVDLLFWGDSFLFADGSVHTHQPFESYSIGREDVEKRILGLKKNEVDYEYFGYTWNKVFRTDIIKKHSIRFIEGLSFREDEIFTANYCRYIGSLKVISNPLYTYRLHSSSLRTTGRNAKMIEMYCDCLKKVNVAWHCKDLVDWESFRYISFLFQAYHCSTIIADKWRIAHKIRNEYLSSNNSCLKPSRFFMLPLLPFHLLLLGKLCFDKVKNYISAI